MKRFTFGQIEWGYTILTLLTLHYQYGDWGLALISIDTDEHVPPYWMIEQRHWSLFKLVWYRKLASWCTIRADIVVFGKPFAWKRMVPEEDELPF